MKFSLLEWKTLAGFNRLFFIATSKYLYIGQSKNTYIISTIVMFKLAWKSVCMSICVGVCLELCAYKRANERSGTQRLASTQIHSSHCCITSQSQSSMDLYLCASVFFNNKSHRLFSPKAICYFWASAYCVKKQSQMPCVSHYIWLQINLTNSNDNIVTMLDSINNNDNKNKTITNSESERKRGKKQVQPQTSKC